MKVGILTFPNSPSHGATLQMFALYQSVKKLGHEAEILNYQSQWMKDGLHTTAGQKRAACSRWLKKTGADLLHLRGRLGFRRFEKNLTKYPRRAFTNKKYLPEVGARYDAVICGSDQVWNPDITGCDLSYFLDFCGENTARVAYAPSFGVESLSRDFGQAAAKELAQFSHLSVREAAGQAIIRETTGAEAQLVADPTLLMDDKEWENYEKPHPQAKGEYILYYTIRTANGNLWNYCRNLAEKCNLKILRIGGNAINRKSRSTDGVEYVCDVSPEEWLYLMHHAKYVVTNSFHGTAFAINYRKNFFVEFSSLTNSRLSHIVNTLGLEAQVVTGPEATLPLKTDYSRAEERLSALRAESVQFLQRALMGRK